MCARLLGMVADEVCMVSPETAKLLALTVVYDSDEDDKVAKV